MRDILEKCIVVLEKKKLKSATFSPIFRNGGWVTIQWGQHTLLLR